MRASRLLRILLLLQNRRRMTSVELAIELEVAPRTILRDIDALTEAGLPVIVHRGNQGGIELGFNYRTRLTGLATDEAEALAAILNCPLPELAALGMADAAARARAKLLESLPDPVRVATETAARRFRFDASPAPPPDPSIAALAEAVRDARLVGVRKVDGGVVELHPFALAHGPDGWRVFDAREGIEPLALAELDHLQIGRPGTAIAALANRRERRSAARL
jgi:predicted DNA-binding transcriptional regulator YafY